MTFRRASRAVRGDARRVDATVAHRRASTPGGIRGDRERSARAFAEPASSCLPEASSSSSSSSERWRLLGAAQRTEPPLVLAGVPFWFAEAQHESYEIAIEDYGPNRPES